MGSFYNGGNGWNEVVRSERRLKVRLKESVREIRSFIYMGQSISIEKKCIISSNNILDTKNVNRKNVNHPKQVSF